MGFYWWAQRVTIPRPIGSTLCMFPYSLDYITTLNMTWWGVGRSSWLLRGLYLSSSLYTFRKCTSGLARDWHQLYLLSVPRIHPNPHHTLLYVRTSFTYEPMALPAELYALINYKENLLIIFTCCLQKLNILHRAWCISPFEMVPGEGLEPSQPIWPQVFKTRVSTLSTIRAYFGRRYLIRTDDPLLPKQVRYQTAPISDISCLF